MHNELVRSSFSVLLVQYYVAVEEVHTDTVTSHPSNDRRLTPPGLASMNEIMQIFYLERGDTV